jgi:MFS family permease
VGNRIIVRGPEFNWFFIGLETIRTGIAAPGEFLMNDIVKRSPAVFYGWFVLAASFAMLFFNSGAQFSIGVMFKPIIADFGWNRSAISLVAMVNMVVYAFSMLLMGKAYDRFGPQKVILIAATFLGAGFIGISLMDSILDFILYYGILCGVGLSGCTVLIFSSLVSKWFERWRGLVISVALSGSCLGQFVLIPVYTGLVIDHGWRFTYMFIGGLTFSVNVVLALLVVRGDPDQLGCLPLGRTVPPAGPTDSFTPRSSRKNQDFTLNQAMRTVSFWLYVGVMFVCGAGDFLVSTHLIPFVTDCGISQTTAGNMLAWFGLFALAGILVAGYASDLIGNKIPVLATFVMRVLLFILILSVQNELTFYIFSLGFGFTMLITGVLTVTLIGKMFGFSNIGVLTGLITTIHPLGGGILIYMGGLVFDRTNSYESVFILYAAMSAAAVVACAFIREKRHALPAG